MDLNEFINSTNNVIKHILPHEVEYVLTSWHISAHLTVLSFVIAFNWCFMKTCLAIFTSNKSYRQLRDVCCKSQQKAYYIEAEKTQLEEQIRNEKQKAETAEERMRVAEHKVSPLEKGFNKIKAERDQLQQKVVTLESELESATEAGLELNRLLSDFLSSQKENVILNSSVDTLQQQITKQSELVAHYESKTKQTEKENFELKEKLEKTNTEMDRIKSIIRDMETNVEIVQSNNEELKTSKAELTAKLNALQSDNQILERKSHKYLNRNEDLLSEVEKFNESIKTLQNDIENKDFEIESLKTIIEELGSKKCSEDNNEDNNSEDNDSVMQTNSISLESVYDIITMKSQIKSLELERDECNERVQQMISECKYVKQKMNEIEQQNESLKIDRENAEKDKLSAQMELEVLSKYYKEKELELGKEIGIQHVQRKIKEENASSLEAQLMTIEEENNTYKCQLQSMKQEIAETERRYKLHITQLEKQCHENWIAARSVERKYEEAKAEAAVLRQTLTMSVKSPVDGLMDDSASSVSSLHDQFLPPPPPPPPPPFMLPMQMPFMEQNGTPSEMWNQNAIPPHIPAGIHNSFIPIGNNNSNAYMHYDHQWDSLSSRDAHTPSSVNSHSNVMNVHSNNSGVCSPILNHYEHYSQQMPTHHYSNHIDSSAANYTTSSSGPLINSNGV